MKVYEFYQNNSAGIWDYDSPLRAEIIYVEANSAHEANRRLTDVTDIDFDDDNYCPCCGPRWSEVYEYDTVDWSIDDLKIYYPEGYDRADHHLHMNILLIDADENVTKRSSRQYYESLDKE